MTSVALKKSIHPATDAECLEYFTALKKRRHHSGYGPGELDFRGADDPDSLFNTNNLYHLLETHQRIPQATPPWSGTPPQLSPELQEALHLHMTAYRSLWMQYYSNYFVPPAYYGLLFNCIADFSSPYYPPSLHEIGEKAIRFYLVDLYPYVLTLEPVSIFRRVCIMLRGKRQAHYDTPNFPGDCSETSFIKDGFIHVLELMTRSFTPATRIYVSPADRYTRGLLTAQQSELTSIVLEAMMAGLRSHIRHKRSIKSMSMEMKWWILCVSFVANRSRSERIELLLLRYLKEDGYRRKVVKGIRKSSEKYERTRSGLAKIGAWERYNQMLRPPCGPALPSHHPIYSERNPLSNVGVVPEWVVENHPCSDYLLTNCPHYE